MWYMRMPISFTVHKTFTLGESGVWSRVKRTSPMCPGPPSLCLPSRSEAAGWRKGLHGEQAQPPREGGHMLAWETVLYPLLCHKISVRCWANFWNLPCQRWWLTGCSSYYACVGGDFGSDVKECWVLTAVAEVMHTVLWRQKVEY